MASTEWALLHPVARRTIGILVFVPAIYLFVAVETFLLFAISGGVHGDGPGFLLALLIGVASLWVPMLILAIVLVATCLRLAVSTVPRNERLGWGLALVFGSAVSMPIFYWRVLRVHGRTGVAGEVS